MSTRALRTTRLLTIAALACLGLAVFAQSALASHGRIQVAKINQGGNPSDTFAFHPTLTWTTMRPAGLPPASFADFSLAGGQTSQQFSVACDLQAAFPCSRDYSNVTLQVAEQPKPGYTLTDITCRYTQSNDVNNLFSAGPPTLASPVKPANEVSVNLAAGTVNLHLNYNEWVICWFTNTYTGTPPGSTPGSGTTGSSGQTPQIQVSPEMVRPGSAKLNGPKGCPDTNAVAATVTGKRIVKVTFYVDHKKVKVLTKPNKRGGWSLAVNMRKIAYGSHRVEAKVEFAKSSGTKTKTLRLSFSRCGANNVRPQFTG